jgi:hypothetical protein
MADAAHSGNAGFHSSPGGYWPDIGSKGVVAPCFSLAEMLSSFTTNSRSIHWNRPASGAFSQSDASRIALTLSASSTLFSDGRTSRINQFGYDPLSASTDSAVHSSHACADEFVAE